MKRTEIVQRIKQALQRVVPTAKVILYGSEARGDARADSDIDLLILLQDKERITLNDRMKLTEPLYDI
ncbi:MAG: nucleotidyltransferase domain-containing protein [Bacteroidaceae bacterium]|nr:nucleotidyltransferase domain-containing protein [Bacteroidaceae bacterium]